MLSFFIHLAQSSLGLLRELVIGIALEKFLESFLRDGGLVQVLTIDLADAEQCSKSILAARILPAQKLILTNGRLEPCLVVIAPSLLSKKFGDCEHAGIGARGCRSEVIDLAKGVDYAVVVLGIAIAFRTPVARFAHLQSLVVVLKRDVFLLRDAHRLRASCLQQEAGGHEGPDCEVTSRAAD